ncbi:hypothetical protein AVEN_259251-1 [Araneus ventricosus]|uniref:Uncharacterized protein n=1 Tax=Araneus ventricosus TaxID=182803 RepID=A0A4Y2R9L1_ARAVE|nr:hypothetical protein AVEN_259251-1 [Araneus ventricosus]
MFSEITKESSLFYEAVVLVITLSYIQKVDDLDVLPLGNVERKHLVILITKHVDSEIVEIFEDGNFSRLDRARHISQPQFLLHGRIIINSFSTLFNRMKGSQHRLDKSFLICVFYIDHSFLRS